MYIRFLLYLLLLAMQHSNCFAFDEGGPGPVMSGSGVANAGHASPLQGGPGPVLPPSNPDGPGPVVSGTVIGEEKRDVGKTDHSTDEGNPTPVLSRPAIGRHGLEEGLLRMPFRGGPGPVISGSSIGNVWQKANEKAAKMHHK